MRRLAMWLGLLLGALSLVGCGATGPRYSEASKSFPPLAEDQGRIVFYRPGIFGASVQPEVRLNGQIIGTSQPNSFFFVDRPVGTYRAISQTEVEAAIAIRVRPQQETYVEMGITMGLLIGQPTFELVTREKAQGEISQLAYGGSRPLSQATAGAPTPSSAPPAAQATANTTARAAGIAPSAPVASTLAPSTPASGPKAATPAAEAASRPAVSASNDDKKPFAKTSSQDLQKLLQPANQ